MIFHFCATVSRVISHLHFLAAIGWISIIYWICLTGALPVIGKNGARVPRIDVGFAALRSALDQSYALFRQPFTQRYPCACSSATHYRIAARPAREASQHSSACTYHMLNAMQSRDARGVIAGPK
jgi:hypothetical protein